MDYQRLRYDKWQLGYHLSGCIVTKANMAGAFLQDLAIGRNIEAKTSVCKLPILFG